MSNRVTSIHQLRSSSGVKTGRTTTFTIDFRVGVVDDTVSPQEILERFPVGSPLHLYTGFKWKTDFIKSCSNLFSMCLPWYAWFAAQPDCSMSGAWEPPMGRAEQWKALLSEARIQGRSLNGTSKNYWKVQCTFTDQTRDQGYWSSPVVTPEFPTKSIEVNIALFNGFYKRVTDTDMPLPCDQTFGFWQNECPTVDDASPLPSPPIGSDISKSPPMFPMNSAGDPLKNTMKSSYGVEPYRVEWFSFTLLDLHCAIGKVNSNKYKLQAFDRPYSGESYDWDYPNRIFCRTFEPRELLVKNVSCTPMNMVGRNCYKYTVELVADPNFHDVFVLDSGMRQRADPGSPMPDGETSEEGDTPGTSQAKAIIPGSDGQPSRKESLLDGNGYPLIKGDEVLDPADIWWLRYRHRLEIEFPDPSEITADRQYHYYDPTSQFQFMMDGGERFLDTTQPAWPRCAEGERTEPPAAGDCKGSGTDSKYDQPPSPQT